jgi:hypothetical protein
MKVTLTIFWIARRIGGSTQTVGGISTILDGEHEIVLLDSDFDLVRGNQGPGGQSSHCSSSRGGEAELLRMILVQSILPHTLSCEYSYNFI